MFKLKNSITKKVFIFTIIPIFLLILFLIASQYLFFNKFYIAEKEKSLKKNSIELQDYLDNYNLTEDLYTSLIYNFEQKNTAKVVLISLNGEVNFALSPYSDNKLKEYETASKAVKHWYNSDNYFDVLIKKDISSYQFQDPDSKDYYTIIASQLNTRVPTILFVVSTLQPLDEANKILSKYYLYFIISAVMILIIVSIVLSKIITKPLIEIKNTAHRMSSLDFSISCNVSSDDELGSLGESLNSMSKKLDNTLTELTQANSKLKDDIERERELEQMRKEFIGDISHELKTPLSIVRGYAEALQDGIATPDDMKFYTDTIIEEVNNLNTLVLDMSNLSKLENDPYNINIEYININTFFDNLSKKYSVFLKDYSFHYKVDPKISSDYFSNFDSHRITEVLNNFLSNAERHTPIRGNITLSLEVESSDRLVISVANDGSNISEGDLSNIWSKFYRIDKSRNKNSGGSGLGLAISRRILDIHNFSYGVKNTSSGVSFYFVIPMEG